MPKKHETVSSPNPNPYVEQATQWLKSASRADMFSSSASTAICAVAEYLANQNSNSIYCEHPDHNHRDPCCYRAVGCSPKCFCCMGELARGN